jgi:hypothetical protein
MRSPGNRLHRPFVTPRSSGPKLWGVLVPSAFALALAACTPVNSDDGDSPGTGGSSGARSGGSSGGGGTGGSASRGGSGGTPSGQGGSGAGGTTATGGTSGGDGGSSGTGGDGGSATGGSAGPGSGGSSGTGGASGGPDASVGNDGPPASGAGCAGTSVKTAFCADFDDQTNGQEPKGTFGLNKGGYATMTVDTSNKYSGTQSLHIKLTNAPDSGHARLEFSAPVMPLPSNDIHGRMMVFLSRNVKNHWDLVTAFASDKINDSESVIQDTFGSYGSDGHIESVHQPGDDSVDSTTKFPVGRWACLQWEFNGSPTMHQIKVKLDGQFIDKGMNLSKSGWKAATFKSMGIGWINYEGGVGGVIDMFIDDLAFGEQEIPCPAAK